MPRSVPPGTFSRSIRLRWHWRSERISCRSVRLTGRSIACAKLFTSRARRKKPVVLSVPLDLQTEEFPYLPDYTPSTDLMPRAQVVRPDPAVVDQIVAMVAEAERPIVLGGRGAMWS